MKKIMFLFIMVIGLMSSLSASDTGQLGIKVPNITAGNTIDWKKFEDDLDEAIKQSALTTDKQLGKK